MGSYRSLLLIGVFAGLIGGAVYWYVAPPSPDAPPEPDPREKSKPSQTIEDFTFVENTGPREVWKIRAPKARRSDGSLVLDSPRITLVRAGDTTVRITSREGEYQLDEKKIQLRGDVVVRRLKQEQTLRTEILNWDRKDGTITTDQPVRLESPRGVLTAVGLRADLTQERMRFQSDVEYSSH